MGEKVFIHGAGGRRAIARSSKSCFFKCSSMVCVVSRGSIRKKPPPLQKANKFYQQQSIFKISFRFSTTDGFGWLWTNMSRP